MLPIPDEQVTVEGRWDLRFQHAAGRAASRFLIAVRDQAILLASTCPNCGRVSIPPRSFCESCFTASDDDLVEVGPNGVIESFCITYMDFPGYPDAPHAIAYVRPLGADTAMCNFVHGGQLNLADPDASAELLAIGTPVTAEFEDDRVGRVTDFWWSLDG